MPEMNYHEYLNHLVASENLRESSANAQTQSTIMPRQRRSRPYPPCPSTPPNPTPPSVLFHPWAIHYDQPFNPFDLRYEYRTQPRTTTLGNVLD
jgi:hypothetical protein